MLARNAVSADMSRHRRRPRQRSQDEADGGAVRQGGHGAGPLQRGDESMGVFTATAINMVTQLACVSRNFMEFLSSNVAHICKCHHRISFKI